LRLTHGDIRVLLGGDCESWGCERSFSPGPIDLYKVHHHGSSDSSAFGFLREMSPSIALIGVGAGNDYGHPDAISLEKFRELGTDVYRTDLDGNIVVTSNGYSTAVATQVQ
jgi:competence protein ComEC